MANSFTNLIPDAYVALDQVVRELVGFIPAVQRNSAADRVAKDQTLRITQAPDHGGAADITPSMTPVTAADQTIGNKSLTFSKFRKAGFYWTGEEQMNVNAGPGYLSVQQQQIAQAIRTLINEVEVDVAVEAYKGGSRAYGTAGTTPFATDLSDIANLRKILADNGAPLSDLTLVIDTAAGAKLRNLTNLYKVNEAGGDSLLRQGVLLDLQGIKLRESAQVQTPAVGTGSAYVTGAAYAVGVTTIAVITGTGTILAGDVVTIGAHKYVVATALAAGSFTISAPGLRAAVASGAAVTVNAAAARNVLFERESILLATRLPAVPAQGDSAIMREVITDPRSGLTLELAVYPGYRMVTCEVALAWGVKAYKNQFIANLLG